MVEDFDDNREFPSSYNRIDSIEISKDKFGKIKITVAFFSSKKNSNIICSFINCRQMKISLDDKYRFLSSVFYIKNIKNRGMEEVHWEVSNWEDFEFLFYCEKIEI